MPWLALLLSACVAPPPCEAPVGWHEVEGGIAAEVADCAAVELTAQVLGEGDLTVDLRIDGDRVVPEVRGTGTFRALVLRGAVELSGDEPPVLWRQGYQSWSWSGVVRTQAIAWQDGLPVAGGDGDPLSLLQETPYTSWWLGLLGRPDGASLLLGALSARQTKVYTAWSADEVAVVFGGRGEAIEVAPERPLTLDPLVVRVGEDAYALHRDHARAVPVPALAAPPTGWATWYAFYGDLEQQRLDDNLTLAASHGLDLFQLDDGWQVRWGDWTASDHLEGGTAGLASRIAALGLVPGLWMAPFYVDRQAPAYLEHADWWVRSEGGAELSYSNLGTGSYAVLDVTHPEAAAWLVAQITARREEGFAYFKLDFLYAGAQEGLRHEPVTGMQAYRRGLELLREATGDAWVLACGAPLLPTVGLVQSFRTGSDIAYEFAPDPRVAYLRSQARSTAARSWANGIWWWNDPDQLLVRPPLDEAQARGAVVAQAVSGGPWLLGDDLVPLGDRTELALTPAAVASRGQAVRPLDPLRFVSGFDAGPAAEVVQGDDQVPVRWLFEDGREVLLNLSDRPVQAGSVTLAPGEGSGFW